MTVALNGSALPGDRDVQIDAMPSEEELAAALAADGVLVYVGQSGGGGITLLLRETARNLLAALPRRDASEGGDDLGAAWNEAEAALPEGWWVHDLAAWSFDDMAYRAEAATAGGHFWAGKSKREKEVGTRTFAPGPNIAAYGPTPAAALRALAAALTEGSR